MTFYEMIEHYYGKEQRKYIEEALNYDPVYAQRFNRLKPFDPEFASDISFLNPKLEIPENYPQAVTHPFHHAGAYYLQDPSATLAVEFMDLQADDIVLDLCAAPGGKSTEILNQIPDGFLIANEINPKRNQRLQFNLNRWGHENVVVTQMSGTDLADQLENRFDKVLLDAPCSAEGLVRRNPDLIESYQLEHAYEYQKIQKALLEDAYQCVVDGGSILYATCTLNPIENEEVIAWFLDKYPSCELIDLEHPLKTPGLNNLKETAHFFPSVHGEGHYMALIKCKKEAARKDLKFEAFKPESFALDDHSFFAHYKKENDAIFALTKRGFLAEELKITMDGVPLAMKKAKNHVFRHAASQYPGLQTAFPIVSLSKAEAYAYCYGESIKSDVKGLVIVAYQGACLGFAKGVQGQLKNQYPKVFRNRFISYD